jgi:phage protein D
MAEYENFASDAIIEIDGTELDAEKKADLDRVEVEDHLSLPDTFTIRFRDRRGQVRNASAVETMLEDNGWHIGSTVKISAQPLGSPDPLVLIEGEVTGLEGVYESRGGHVAMRGHDKFHRLLRERKTESFTQVTDGSLVRTVGGSAGVPIGQVDDPNIQYEHISRFNLTAADFLRSRATVNDRELRVVTNGTSQLAFQSHGEASEAPSPDGEAPPPGPPEPKKLINGTNMLSFAPRVTSPQHKEVEARGWDPLKKTKLVSPKEQVTGTNAELELGEDAAALAGKFGAALFSQPSPHAVQAEVDAVAKSLAAKIGSTYAEAEATILGMPVRAGDAVSVEGVSKEFVGKWTVASSRHVFDAQGYRTHLVLSGPQDRTLYGLITKGSQNTLQSGAPPINGVVVGIVTNVKDPDKHGRVKVKFPWLSDDYESDWAWVVQAGAGANRGAVVLPEVNDTVLVAFNMGDPQYPYVIGGLYNGQDKADPGDADAVDANSGEINWRGFISRGKHRIIFSDKSGDEYIELSTKDKKYMLKLDQGKTQIEVTSDGKITITGKQDITVKGDANIKVEAGGNLEEKATGNVKIEATGNMELKGAMVKIEASGVLEAKGSVIKLN